MKREELHDIILGVALVALGYALYQHHKATVQRNMADQDAIATAINTAQQPNVSAPAPIAVQGNDQTGYTFDLNTLLDGAY